jgi:hypothetical protein
MLATLMHGLGNLDRIEARLRMLGMVNCAPGPNQTPSVMNCCSELILELCGPDAGALVRSAVGMAELPFDIPVEIEAGVAIRLQLPHGGCAQAAGATRVTSWRRCGPTPI